MIINNCKNRRLLIIISCFGKKQDIKWFHTGGWADISFHSITWIIFNGLIWDMVGMVSSSSNYKVVICSVLVFIWFLICICFNTCHVMCSIYRMWYVMLCVLFIECDMSWMCSIYRMWYVMDVVVNWWQSTDQWFITMKINPNGLKLSR